MNMLLIPRVSDVSHFNFDKTNCSSLDEEA
jgi:hypothetical protein